MPVHPELPGLTPPARDVYSVTRLNREVRSVLERGLGVIWVEGELSNFSQPASGHWYFSLKDNDAQLRCAMFRMKNSLVGFTPKPGAQLLLRGRISVYEARGEYQLIVEHLEEAGVGALKREFERLKTRLAAEGLFALERKRRLPRFPRRIGVITSPSGAALHDILQILRGAFRRRGAHLPGAGAGRGRSAGADARARSGPARAECEVLILARGGGSLEDLWAFNDERLARALHACALPVVSASGTRWISPSPTSSPTCAPRRPRRRPSWWCPTAASSRRAARSAHASPCPCGANCAPGRAPRNTERGCARAPGGAPQAAGAAPG